MRHPSSPPRVANWILGRLLPERDRDAVIGDLVEEYAVRARSASRLTVSQWYWEQVYRSLPSIVWSYVRGGHCLPTLGVAIGAYIAAGMVEYAGDAAISRLLPSRTLLQAILGLLLGLSTMALGGYAAAWIRPGAAPVLAAIVLITVAVLMVTKSGTVPLWYQLAFLIAGPLASLAGGTLFLRRER